MSEPKKYQYIDSLRGIAILLVILVHIATVLGFMYYPQFNEHPIFAKFVHNGMYGVLLFFILSAFTLIMSHYNRIGEPHSTRSFIIRRFFRIAPMYYLAIVGITFLKFIKIDAPLFGLMNIPIGNLLSEIFFISAFFPQYINQYVPGGWSVSVEFIFYLFVPLICSKIKNLNSALILIMSLVSLSAIFSSFIETKHYDLNFILFNPIIQLPAFALGIFIYLFLNKAEVGFKKFTLVCLTLFIFAFCYTPIPYNFLIGLGFSMLIVIQSKFNFRLLSNKLLASIGKVSYSMYLIHFIVIFVLIRFKLTKVSEISDFKTFLFNFIAMYLIVAIITFILAGITYKLIEIPGQNYGHKLINKLYLKDKLQTTKK